MNTILETILKNRQGHYCHAIEVCSAYEIICIIEDIANEFPEATKEELNDFFNNIDVYSLNEDDEEEIHNFNFEQAIEQLF